MTWQDDFNKKRLAKGGWYGCIVDDGWKNIVLEADAMLSFIDPNYKINQVKEKFGTLRFYFETEKPYGKVEHNIMDAIVRAAEFRSTYTCEWCGKYGEIRTDQYYVLTLCDECSDKRKENNGKA